MHKQQYTIKHIAAMLVRQGVFPSIKHVLTQAGFDVGYCALETRIFTPEQEAALMIDLVEDGFVQEK